MTWLDEPRQQGVVTVVETDGEKITKSGLRPWQESHTRNDPGSPVHVLREDISKTEQVISPFETPPPPAKRSGITRKEEIAKELFAWAMREVRAHPTWRPPASMIQRFKDASWQEGDPISHDVAERLAIKYLEEAKRQLGNDAIPVVGKPGEWAAPRL